MADSPAAPPGGKPLVVIIGGGPAGLCAAAALARQGCSVQVFERREHPDRIPSDAEDRAFVVGFDLEAFERPNSGVVHLEQLRTHAAERPTLPWKRDRTYRYTWRMLLGDRMSWVEGMGLDIACTFNAAFEGLDLQASMSGLACLAAHLCCRLPEGRVASIRRGEGPSEPVPFDLLVGADGVYSKVRDSLAAVLPPGQLSVSLEPSRQLYKVIRGLPAKVFGLPDHVSRFTSAVAGDHPCGGFIIVVPRYNDGQLSGSLRMNKEGWEGLHTAQDYAALLARYYPTFPAACVPKVAAQLAERSAHVASTRVSASTFHGPGVVLIGDAAHAVLPLTGNGMNSALQDGAMLGELLAAHGGRLAAVPAAFTAARKADADALLWLDRSAHVRLALEGRWRLGHLLSALQRSTHQAPCTTGGCSHTGTAAGWGSGSRQLAGAAAGRRHSSGMRLSGLAAPVPASVGWQMQRGHVLTSAREGGARI
ncbi:hypothetical protein ABPG75_002803 [Micractinium tetrahymenae]